jgi:hypothetical protein
MWSLLQHHGSKATVLSSLAWQAGHMHRVAVIMMRPTRGSSGVR